jgi:hypothetical protein
MTLVISADSLFSRPSPAMLQPRVLDADQLIPGEIYKGSHYSYEDNVLRGKGVDLSALK